MAFNPAPKPIKEDKKPKKNISSVSEKRKESNEMYSYLSKIFKDKNKKCKVCNKLDTVHVHHQKGRQGFDDEWAKWMNVPLLLDIRWWLPVCAKCHDNIENNPEYAYENKYSYKRNSKD